MDTKGLSVQEYIDWLQRYIIVHSCIYYFNNDNFISDREYDAKSKELVALREAHPEEWKNSEYYAQYGDHYVGNTGMDLLIGLSEHQLAIIRSIMNQMAVSRRKS